MEQQLSEHTTRAAARGVVHILRNVKTLLSLAALALLVVLGIVCFALYQSATKSDFLVLGLSVIGCALVVVIVYLAQKTSPGPASRTTPDIVAAEVAHADRSYPYDEPSKLLVFRYGTVDPQGNCTLDVLRVTTIRALRDGDITVKTRRHSEHVILESSPVSHPISSKTYGDGTADGVEITQLHGLRRGDQQIHAVESTRQIVVGGDRARPLPDDVILQIVIREFLTTPYHSAAGTRINVPTGHLRMLAYFPEGQFPLKVQTVQVYAHGKIRENVMRQEMVKKDNLWILEADEIDAECGMYFCWLWKQPNLATETA